MGFVDLFSAASMPVLKVLIITALGSFLALDSVDILGQSTRKQVNDIVFFVFSPSLVGSNLVRTITLESIISMWFMPVNILLTYIIGSARGWVLLIISRPPQHLKDLILGSCAADLFSAASMPVLKVLIITALGSFLALDSVDILGQSTRKQVNDIVFFVFSPSLVGSNLVSTITLESIISMWFMPVNILLTYIIGSALGWVLLIISRPPQHLKGLILGSCAAGNLGSLPLIIIPAVCKERGSPFGDPDVCHEYAMAYASLSMAIGAIFLWTYVYNLVRIFSVNSGNNVVDSLKVAGTMGSNPLSDSLLESSSSTGEVNRKWTKVTSETVKQYLGNFCRQVNLKAVFAPSTIGAIVGFTIGTITPLRRLLIGPTAPFRVIQDSASLVGDAAIPTMTLIVGGNLIRGLKRSGISSSLIIGIVLARLILLPLFGILIVKGAIYFSLVPVDPLYLFVLLLQYALPPAMNIGTITQLFGAGETECSVIMLWAYSLASFSLTCWSMFFMWLVA